MTSSRLQGFAHPALRGRAHVREVGGAGLAMLKTER